MENFEASFWKQPESRRLEYKESLPKGDQLAKTVVAFANGAGGRIVFGVRNQTRRYRGRTKLGPSWDQVTGSLELSAEEIESICILCLQPVTIQQLMQRFDWSNRSKFRDKFLRPLLETHLIEMTLPEKSRSPLQRYKTTEEGRRFLGTLGR